MSVASTATLMEELEVGDEVKLRRRVTRWRVTAITRPLVSIETPVVTGRRERECRVVDERDIQVVIKAER